MAKIATDGSEEEPDVCVIELGGTVGDIESMPFVEVRKSSIPVITVMITVFKGVARVPVPRGSR